MCGIAGVMLEDSGEVGNLLMSMFKGLQHRGLDSAGVALYKREIPQENEYLIKVFTRDIVGALSKVATAIAQTGGDIRSIKINAVKGYGFDTYIIKSHPVSLPRIIEGINSTGLSKVLSLGRKMEIIKDTTTADELERHFNISSFLGSHAIGHVRFSTESCVDLLHSHPFQSFSYPDMALVHNGQITNYWKSRERLERKGISFQTENDSELIVHYLIEKIRNGESLANALKSSVNDLDGPFSYVFSTGEEIGMVRDKLGLRPLVVSEGRNIRALASEESALRMVGSSGKIRNLRPGEVLVWQLN
jgi:glutamine phosphoribosylpyrophosphate amidotransferase